MKDKFKILIGQPIELVKKVYTDSGKILRIVHEDECITTDYVFNRITICINNNKIVTYVSEG